MPKKSKLPALSDEADADAPIRAESNPQGAVAGRYTVVARRYRPRGFDELVGQQNVATALKTAIESDRVGHAYLFTGARGVGKTSTARIFAKALNLSHNANGTETISDDLAASIDSGEDMDVIEIDGASNRGIEEIRQLRANATVRPSRARYKIYIIDEVHMLTIQAFNALLKTLEEPPSHVKFIFCTTDPEKIPITVLSRCQRFDFPPIKTDEIQSRLAQICSAEGVQAEPDALRLIARRANGSMRDSQSLLEQLLSFAEGTITVAIVHSMLGTADDARLEAFAKCLIQRNAGDALGLLDQAVEAGVDAGQFAEQVLGYLRDLMTLGVGANPELMRTANPADVDRLREMTHQWGTMTLLAAIQILDETLVKMRHSVQSRILLEVAIVQICHLQDLQVIANLAQAIRDDAALPRTLPPRLGASEPADAAGSLPTANEKKNEIESLDLAVQTPHDIHSSTSGTAIEVHAVKERVAHEPVPIPAAPALAVQNGAGSVATSLNAARTLNASPADADVPSEPAFVPVDSTQAKDLVAQWRKATADCDGMLGGCAAMAFAIEADRSGETWDILLPFGSEFALQILSETSNLETLRQCLFQATHRTVQLRFRIATAEQSPRTTARPGAPTAAARQSLNQSQLTRHVSSNELISQLVKTLDAEVIRVDVPADYTIDG